MNQEHLDTEQIVELASGAAGESAGRHGRECGECRERVERLQAGIAGTAARLRSQAEHDEAFWARQRAVIRSRAAGRRPARWLRYASTAVIALLLVAALLFSRTRQPKPLPSDAPSDEVLLEQVESDLDRDVPQALAAAALSNDQE
jgi:hypothetical protein